MDPNATPHDPNVTAPATADVDPANLTGPGVTTNPDPVATANVSSISEENARLRAELLQENEALKAALADTRAASLGVQGLSDEDVRQIEHPEEFGSLAGDNKALQARIDELQAQHRTLTERLDTMTQPATERTATVTSDPLAEQTAARAETPRQPGEPV